MLPNGKQNENTSSKLKCELQFGRRVLVMVSSLQRDIQYYMTESHASSILTLKLHILIKAGGQDKKLQ